ncbi:winged helix-turn-helix domain-containing protein [Pokkaliibacter sp. MBI-7]|uniref:winged helix-turn-helix domain-containing protein n=1 Tax=Pokkaliibacter sp. MBI-7 TaxID=3040600 RepID=UPI00244C3632|nr:winged helix-turn-helix domain-containing protein [Pokkaliibacter sp. MBI-7]MDH2434402.1 winged helix-turn-helix domain-containing protein [Pokkaliibacter sp. MBI-7]
MKILIGENHSCFDIYTLQGLMAAGMCIVRASSGVGVMQKLQRDRFDVVVLESGDLGGMTSCDVFHGVRNAGMQVPVLFLYNEAQRPPLPAPVPGTDQLRCPISLSVLLSHLQALEDGLPPVAADQHFRLADLDVDLDHQCASRGGCPLSLTEQEFRLLALLIRHQGRSVPLAAIGLALQDTSPDSAPERLELAIRQLRQKVDEAHKVHLIHSTPERGYVLEVS